MRIAALGLLIGLAACGGLPKPTGNETGGIIDWFGTNEREVFEAATLHCSKYGKKARIRDIKAHAGGHAFFDCI